MFLSIYGCDSVYPSLLGTLKWLENRYLFLGLECEGKRSFNFCYDMTSKFFKYSLVCFLFNGAVCEDEALGCCDLRFQECLESDSFLELDIW